MICGLASVGRLWRTVRWLKRAQILGRVALPLPRPAPAQHDAPPLRARAGPWVPVPERPASMLGPTTWRFLSQQHDLAEIGWDNPQIELLWRYNQHYFDDLNAADAAERRPWQRELIRRWIKANPPGRGTGWAPYPTSQRIVNWVKFFIHGEPPEEDWLHSLAVQARWLERRLERHLLGNHLFVNAKALLFAGLYFQGAEAARWLAKGERVLRHELPEQVLPDGGQFERSPMYHALALEDLLDLLNLIGARATADLRLQPLAIALRDRAGAMLHWLRCLCHPGGTLARFNDCAEGIAPRTNLLEGYAAALGVLGAQPPAQGVLYLQPSGYLRAARGPALALLDLAPIGPDHLPGHAHADTLCFELSVAGREIVVNRGTSVYGTGKRRQWERGTAAHSTLQIGAHDSSEVWAGFRVGRRARPGPVQIDGWQVEGSHDGYTHLPGAPRHHRRWRLETDCLQVDDWLDPVTSEASRVWLHLAPGLAIEPLDASSWRVTEDGAERVRLVVLAGRARTMTTQHALTFGRLVDAPTLALELVGGQAALRIAWDC